ncbi:MAG TPA: transcriptional regulator [Clostridium sp.]|nr:transcriptional regulator [Clostridium sp.]
MLGDTLKEIRESKNIGLNELSRLCGVSAGYISALERNEKKNPSQKTLKKIADVLEIPLESLFNFKFMPLSYEEDKDIKDNYEEYYRTPKEAALFLLKTSSVMSYCDYDLSLLSEDEINDFSQDLLNQLKLLSFKYKR